jgi:hypothetical protein
MFIEEIKESVKLSSPRMGNKHACSEIMDTKKITAYTKVWLQQARLVK